MRAVLIDTDPGIDDSMAIQAALVSPVIRVEALTTVFGNCSIDIATRNALINLEVAGRTEIPVARGAHKPLSRDFHQSSLPGPHGRDGLGDVPWKPPRANVIDTPAPELIVEKIMQAPGRITLLAVASLTNLALALNLEPRIAQHVHEVVVMGGVMDPSDRDPVVEFNFQSDPEAASKVLQADWPLVMVGLDVTMSVIMTAAQLQTIDRGKTRASQFLSRIVPTYLNWCRTRYQKEEVYLHDVCALAYVMDPSLFQTELMSVDVETRDPRTSGRTVRKATGTTLTSHRIKVCRKVDSQRVVQNYIDTILSPVD